MEHMAMGFSRYSYSYNMFCWCCLCFIAKLKSQKTRIDHVPPKFSHRHGQIENLEVKRDVGVVNRRRQSRAPKTNPLESLESIDIYWIVRELDPKYTWKIMEVLIM